MDKEIIGRIHKVEFKRNGKAKVYFEPKRDSLTGLMTYENFIKHVDNFIATNKDTSKGLVIVYSDIRHFKVITDKYGTTIGNNVLEHFADTVKNSSPNIIAACRIYFDNIVTAAIYDNARDPEEFANNISRLNRKLEEELQERYLDQHITINTGISISIDTTNIDVDTVISNANLARKRAKDIKSKEALLFSRDMINTLVRQMELSASLPRAISNEELTVYYQPKVECNTEKVIGAEALVRWIKPDGTFIYPDQFIPLFESNGLIVEVDYYVYRKVFAHIRKRLDNHLPVVPISMNVSRIHLITDGIIEYVQELFEEYQIPPELVEFELTENIYIENMKTVIPLINQFRAMGITISMDDFGSGHSSLNELNSLPIDVLKLDKVFMTDTLNGKQQIILSSIIDMAKKLNMNVLCEGVENTVQNDFLRDIGCDMVQGYYYSEPLSEANFEEYIKDRI